MKKVGESLIRIDRLLSNLGLIRRSEINLFMRKNTIKAAGESLKSYGQRVLPSQVLVNDRPLEYVGDLHIVVHKPVGYVCSRSNDLPDEDNKFDSPLIYNLLPSTFLHRSPLLNVAGRLDKWATGVVILTQDGDLLQRIISPRKRLPKTYLVHCVSPFVGNEAEIFASGTLMLRSEERPCLPAEFTAIDSHNCKVTLYEGRYHQLRRMFGALGNKVDQIHRESIGGVSCNSLKEGEWRSLTASEIDSFDENKRRKL